MHQHRIRADDVADGRQQAVTGTIGQILGPLQQQRRLVRIGSQGLAGDGVGGVAGERERRLEGLGSFEDVLSLI